MDRRAFIGTLAGGLVAGPLAGDQRELHSNVRS